jgi:glycosyltransferase involved in cell wall biosynthesis
VKILMLADTPADPNSGAAGTEWQTARALRDLEHEVDMLWADDIGPRRIGHGNLHYLLELPRQYRRAVRRAFARKHYDVVHVNQPHGFLAAEWLARTHPEVPFVHRSHGLELRVERDLARWRPMDRSEKRSLVRRGLSSAMAAALARHTRRIAAVAAGHIVYVTECRDFLEQELGVARDRIAVIPGAAPDAMLETPAPMTEERLHTLLYASQFAFFKAPMIAAAAMNALAAADSSLRFLWLCHPTHHNDVLQLLSEETRQRIELLPWVSQEELRSVYDRAGVFLFPSFFEGFGKVFLEAMARGCVVVATDIAGAHDIIDPGNSGFLVPPGDSDAITNAVSAIASDLARAKRISEAAAAKARHYTWRRAAESTAGFYERLVAMKR